jgi:hypothetical protein
VLRIYSIYLSACTVANTNNKILLQMHPWSSTATGDLHIRLEPQQGVAQGVAGVGDNDVKMPSRR